MKLSVGFALLKSSLAVIVLTLTLFGMVLPALTNLDSYEWIETHELKGVKPHLLSPNSHTRHHHPPHFRGQSLLEQSKDTYGLLKSVRKVTGIDGKSPVCAICSLNSVDPKTYDYFCLPDSEGMDGEICDRLTLLGTTTSHRIMIGCKLLLTRRPLICK